MHHRRGTVLIVIAGIAALLATLAFTFLARMRGDAEETQVILGQAQCRLMLASANCYILEASRAGYDRYPATPTDGGLPVHEEAFGWIDVRDGSIGPKTQDGRVCWSAANTYDDGRTSRPAWPAVGGIARCPMYVPRIAPYALELTASYNPMDTNESPMGPWFCTPIAKNPDPRPRLATSWAEHAAGDLRPRVETTDRAWFRVLRDGPSTFLITVGSGATQGFRDWAEVQAQNQTELFAGSQTVFESARNTEARMWYRCEWSAAVVELSYHLLDHEVNRDFEHYLTWPMNASHTWIHSVRTQTHMKNQCGTIRWVQRLRTEPTWW